jgi:hypothetical protein
MAEVRVAQRLANPADVVWALIGDFGGLHRWHPLVHGLDLSWEGRIRTLHYADGSRAVERLEARSDASRRYVYVLVDGALPISDCRATLQVSARKNGCTVIWSSVFEPAGATESTGGEHLRQLYMEGLAALAAALDG